MWGPVWGPVASIWVDGVERSLAWWWKVTFLDSMSTKMYGCLHRGGSYLWIAGRTSIRLSPQALLWLLDAATFNTLRTNRILHFNILHWKIQQGSISLTFLLYILPHYLTNVCCALISAQKFNWWFLNLAIHLTFTKSPNLNHRQYFCLYGTIGGGTKVSVHTIHTLWSREYSFSIRRQFYCRNCPKMENIHY